MFKKQLKFYVQICPVLQAQSHNIDICIKCPCIAIYYYLHAMFICTQKEWDEIICTIGQLETEQSKVAMYSC